MATEVHVRKRKKSYMYDFKLPGMPRERKGGYRTRQAAFHAGLKRMQEMESGVCLITLEQAYKDYMSATRMKDRSKDTYERDWKRIEPLLGHLYVKDVDTAAIDRFKQKLPANLSSQSVNHHLTLLRAVLRFMWKRQKLAYPPYIPMEPVETKYRDWYNKAERDMLLDGMMTHRPQWYLFFYLTCRLGIRLGEVYALSRRSVRHIPPGLIVDCQVQRGTVKRPAKIASRKNNEAYTLAVSQDILDAIQWHIDQGYAGEEYLFSRDGKFPVWLDSHQRPLREVQDLVGLRRLGHHAIGRHSVGSQAVSGGQSMKAVQAQLGHRSEASTHKYAHLASEAQLRVVESLTPAEPPHARKAN